MSTTYQELRNEFKKTFSNYPGLMWKDHISSINNSFPGTFNLSFNEPEHLEAFGNYTDYNKPLIFGKIQPVIRPNDFLVHILQDKNAYKYLGVFDMGGISVSLPTKETFQETTEKIIELGYNFLIEKLKLNPDKLFIKLCKGGNISDLTNDKYQINKIIPQDEVSFKKWVNLGVKKENIILDSTRDTFLALHSFNRITPWGYRNEILYDIGKGTKEEELLDIGTIEYFPWKPILINEKISDIEENNSFCVLIVFGLERLLMIKNNLNHIVECDHIFPLYNKFSSNNNISNEFFTLEESIRTVLRILTDSKSYSKLGRKRRKKFTDYIHAMNNILERKNIEKEKIKDFFEINADLQSFYPELKKNVQMAYHELLEILKKKKT